MELQPIVRMAARNALRGWGREVSEEALDDLAQELWVWYLEYPRLKAKVEAACTDEFDDVQTAAFIRPAFQAKAVKILSEWVSDENNFEGVAQYSSEDIKAELRGEGQSAYLRNAMPLFLEELGRTKPQYREAIRSRYDDGVIPSVEGGAAMILARAHIALFQLVTRAGITEEVNDARKIAPEARHAGGGHGDPTAEMALSLIAAGETTILIYDREGNIVDNTTLREEFLRDDFQMGTAGRSGTDQDSLFDGMFMDIERGAMYRAQVFPELYPEERRMLTENWPQEDLEAYCGGSHTIGYPKLHLVR